MPGEGDGTSDRGGDNERRGYESPEWPDENSCGRRQAEQADAERQGIDPAWSHKPSDREEAGVPSRAAAAVNVNHSVPVENRRGGERCAE
jgi:hypothetical protein